MGKRGKTSSDHFTTAFFPCRKVFLKFDYFTCILVASLRAEKYTGAERSHIFFMLSDFDLAKVYGEKRIYISINIDTFIWLKKKVDFLQYTNLILLLKNERNTSHFSNNVLPFSYSSHARIQLTPLFNHLFATNYKTTTYKHSSVHTAIPNRSHPYSRRPHLVDDAAEADKNIYTSTIPLRHRFSWNI